MKIYIENQTHDTEDGAHHMPLHTQETRQKRAICVRFGEKISGGGMFLPSRGGSQGGHVSSFETGGGIGMGGPLAWGEGGGGGALLSCTPE